VGADSGGWREGGGRGGNKARISKVCNIAILNTFFPYDRTLKSQLKGQT